MDRQEKEQWIDKLLIFANDEVENHGSTIVLVDFDFSEDGEDRKKFLKENKIDNSEFPTIIKACISRDYFKYYCNNDELMDLQLTVRGQGRALSISLAVEKEDYQLSSINIIGTLNADGNVQVGNNNTQNIEIIFQELIEKINDADAPEEEKQEAKNRLKAFLEHPLVGTALGLTGSAIMALLGLGG